MGNGFSFTNLKNQVVALSNFHARTDQGLAFTTEIIDLALANDGVLEILIPVSAAHEIHIVPRAITGGDSILQMFENPTVTVNGTPLTPFNYKRRSDYVAATLFYHTPTTTADGTLIDTEVVVGGAGGNAVGGASDLDADWVLGPGNIYLYRLTNTSGQANIAHLHLDFYEVAVP